MKTAQHAMAAHVSENEVEEVQDLMEDLQENMEMIEEIGEAVSAPLGHQFDEDELMADLAELEEEVMLEAPAAVPAQRNVRKQVDAQPVDVTDLPAVPQNNPVAVEEEDPELADLMAEFA